jgi:VanZ family protein
MTAPPTLIQRLRRAAAACAAAPRAWRLLLVLLIAVVSYLALTPSPPADLDTGWDKLNHLLAFTTLAVTASLSWPASRAMRVLLLCALLGFGGSIEVLQQFVPGRSPEWGDLLAGSIGVACGAVIAAFVLRVLRVMRAATLRKV